MTEKLYAERDAMEMDIAGNHYCRHVSAMTSEGLHSKADIAAELGYRDMQIAALQEQVQKLAAENVAQRDHCDEVYGAGYQQGHLNTVDGIAYAPGIKDDFYHDALQVMAEVETPATDAFIREIGAQAVDEAFISVLDACSSDYQMDEKLWNHAVLHIKGHMGVYYAKLRAGEQP